MKAIRSISRTLVILGAAIALSNCVAPKVPPPAPAPAPRPRPAPPPPLPAAPVDWRDSPQTPGTWLWSISGGQSRATFAQPGGGAATWLSCDRASGKVLLARPGAGTSAVPVQITTSSGSTPLLSDPALSPAGWIVSALPPRSPLLDAIAFSRGRFALETAGQPTLFLPSWPELSRVIEDCR
ncbi:hypothetical protein [Novosphingobium sp.]|uniref:hypothetical protein n=1 Tax=Novosphingobium sp. TaxID=1874826 RepID=UPI0025F01949|nr:hypothetical protein [Novosphingobium sp.]